MCFCLLQFSHSLDFQPPFTHLHPSVYGWGSWRILGQQVGGDGDVLPHGHRDTLGLVVLDGGFFCSMLFSLWASVLSGGLEAGGLEGGGLSAACERFVLWCNQYSLILFDFFFFLLLFVVAIFHVSTVSAVFSPHSPSSGPPFPCDKTET